MDGPMDLDQLPVFLSGEGVEIRATEAGEFTVALVRLDTDFPEISPTRELRALHEHLAGA